MNEVKVPARPHPYPPRIVFLIVLPLLIFPIKKGVATHPIGPIINRPILWK